MFYQLHTETTTAVATYKTNPSQIERTYNKRNSRLSFIECVHKNLWKMQQFSRPKVYIQHTFRCSINETVNHINLVLLIICPINNRKIVYSDEFYSVAIMTLDMIIPKKTGQFYFNTNSNFKTNPFVIQIISSQF